MRGNNIEASATDLAYWKQQLSDIPLLQLPSDHPRPAVQTFRRAKQSLLFSNSLGKQLKTLSREEGVSLFVTLLAAFQTLLCRHTGQEDVAAGSRFAGRNCDEVGGLIGFFENTLVLRTNLSGNPTFRELLGRVRKVVSAAFEHKEIPFENLVKEIYPDRDLSRNPLFQVEFVFQNIPGQNTELPGLAVSPVEIENETTNFDLSLCTFDDPLTGELKYKTDLFDGSTIERMAGHFQTLLEGIVANPDQRIAELPILIEAEKRQLLVEWNATQSDYPKDKCVHELFEEQVERTPDATAVVFNGHRLTYRELNGRANQLAHYLRSLGVGPEKLVGICVERSMDMLIGLLGILKTGGAYVPLDPAYPAERLAFMVKDAQVSVLLTEEKLLKCVELSTAGSQVAFRLVFLDRDWEMICQESAENPVSGVHADNLAYVIYTSGSTGKPKGVLIQHGGIVNHNLAVAKCFALSQQDRVAQCSSFSFDVAVEELFPTWITGATVVLYPPGLCSPGADFLRWIEQEQITVLDLATAFWHAWVYDLVRSEKSLPASLRLVVVGGEKACAEALTKWQPIAGAKVRWINAYGPTETTVGTIFYEPAPGKVIQEDHREIPIGRPIANSQAYILDGHLKPVPIGVPGEIYLGGVGLARGYLNRPELTAERFIANPFSEEPDARLYRTGDLARYLPDGNIEFLGRVDNQVKIRGYRIELGEIEATLNQHPAVQESVVITPEDSASDGLSKRLVAYMVPWQQPMPSVTELRSFLKEKLPDYMVPSIFMELEDLPLTPNGKVDRRSLPVPEPALAELENTFMAPRTPIEELLAGIWAEVLRLAKVGVYDNFFELGGHSLLATQVISRIRGTLKVELPLRAFFEAPTVAGLAEHIEAALRAGQHLQTSPIMPVSRDNPLPLSFSQERLWFLDQWDPGTSVYNSSIAIRIQGKLDIAKLGRSLTEIVRRHEVLRTTFQIIDDQPVQVVVPTAIINLPVINLEKVTEVEREAEAQRLIAEEMRRPFDLTRSPLLRAALLQLCESEYMLLLTIHHIASDGWSFGIFFRELSVLYDTFCSEKSSSLPELAIQYSDFAAWQRQWLQGEVLDSQLGYWKRQLGGSLPVLELPTDHPRPAIQAYQGAMQPVVLSQPVTGALRDLSRREGVTLFMTLLAAFKVLLYRYTEQHDVIVGSPIANRNRTETEELIGCFFNTLVLRTDLSGNPSFRGLLGRVREVCLAGYAHQDLPVEKLIEELQPERDLSRSSLFQVMFILHNTPAAKLELPGLVSKPMEVDGDRANFDLTLSLTEWEQGVGGSLWYSTELFDRTTIERMARQFKTVLDGILKDPDQPIATLPLLTDGDRHQLLVEWNDTQIDYPKDSCIHELFEAQVKRTPDATALVFNGYRLTYRELNRRANQLAHYLRGLGLGPNALVAISLDRSIEMVVAIYGVLKAGGAYVPLDPNYPMERLDYMLKSVNTPVLLTQDRFSPRWKESSAKVVCLDSGWMKIAQHSDQNPARLSGPGDLIYVIYTSGSTGRPKGAGVYHRGFMNLLHWFTTTFTINATDRVLLVSSLSFDLTQKNIYATLIRGGELHLLPSATYDPEQIAQIIEEQRITLVNCTPSAFYPLIEHGGETAYEKLRSLRIVFLGGEPISIPRLREWLESDVGHCEIANTYGPTECTDICAFYRLYRQNMETYPFVPTGRPVFNTQLLVLDKELGLCPSGVAGELCVAGEGVGAGYINDPELTAMKFVPNPFPEISSERIYKTNDLVRYLPDGNIEFLGRIDHQIKLRGFRIELGEIEAVLGKQPGIRDAAVIVREDAPGNKRLVAYIVPKQELIPIKELRSYLMNELPDYMVPSAFVTLEALPLTPNGKIDRRALPVPEQSRPDLEEAFVAPRTPTEEALAKIWTRLLKLELVGIHDNFFDLGGHSLLAVRLIRQTEKAFGKKLPLVALFQAPTIEQLAELISQSIVLPTWSSLYPIQPHGSKPPFFWVHGEDSDAFLPRYLGPDQPLYGLRHQSADGTPALYTTVVDIAAHYLSEIRTVQPQGPYFLGGYCFGAMVAFEIAQQLKKADQEVPLLFFLDPAEPNVNRSPAPSAPTPARFSNEGTSLLDEISRHLQNIKSLKRNEKAHYVLQRVKGKIKASFIDKLLKRIVCRAYLTLGYRIPPSLRSRYILDVYGRAIAGYVPQVHPGRLIVFEADEECDPDRWERLALGGLEIHEIPGDHTIVLHEPYVRDWGNLLKMQIDRAQSLAVIRDGRARSSRKLPRYLNWSVVTPMVSWALSESISGGLIAVF